MTLTSLHLYIFQPFPKSIDTGTKDALEKMFKEAADKKKAKKASQSGPDDSDDSDDDDARTMQSLGDEISVLSSNASEVSKMSLTDEQKAAISKQVCHV